MSACAVATLAFGHVSLAAAHPDVLTVDRVAARFVSPETGGSSRPSFVTERELAFFARMEALSSQATLEPGEYPERFVRVALDRLVARTILSSLFVQRGVALPSFSQRLVDARLELEARVGGRVVLSELMREEGIEEAELRSFLEAEVRAVEWVDRFMVPLLSVSEEALREAFRSATHPHRGAKFEDVRGPMASWLILERFRAAELEFMQSARTRIVVTPMQASK